MGFFTAALIVGRYVGYPQVSKGRLLLAAIAVTGTVYGIGALWLATWVGIFKLLLPLEALTPALLIGVAPFLPWDPLKSFIAWEQL